MPVNCNNARYCRTLDILKVKKDIKISEIHENYKNWVSDILIVYETMIYKFIMCTNAFVKRKVAGV
jgi:hypothetical protein